LKVEKAAASQFRSTPAVEAKPTVLKTKCGYKGF